MPGGFRAIVSVVAAGVLLTAAAMPAAVAAALPPEACPPESTDDLWDVAQGTTMGPDTGLRAGSTANLFGAMDSSPEEGVTIFRDDQADGFVHSVEWITVAPVTIRSFLLIAAHDHNSLQRSIKAFRLFAIGADDVATLLYEFEPTLPYGSGDFGNYLFLCDNVLEPVSADHFRAEFVQNGGFSFPGTRAVELDGYGVDIAALAPTPSPAPITAQPPTPEPTEAPLTPPPTEVPPSAAPVPTAAPEQPAAADQTPLLAIGAITIAAVLGLGLWFAGARRRRASEPGPGDAAR